ncbi:MULTISPECIES: hypothetical protein [unclassified Kribbella]
MIGSPGLSGTAFLDVEGTEDAATATAAPTQAPSSSGNDYGY